MSSPIGTKQAHRAGLLITSHDYADLLARLYYAMPLPPCLDVTASRTRAQRIAALIRRGAITPDHRVTEFGVRLLAVYTTVRQGVGKRCPVCLHTRHASEFTPGTTRHRSCRAKASREYRQRRKCA